MTTYEEHKNIVKEFMSDINEKIRADLLSERQKIIGFAASEASVNMFALLLHKKNLISPGFNINHKFFSSIKRAESTFDFKIEDKEKILESLVKQEEFRDKLCYGKSKDKALVEKALENLFVLKKVIEKGLGEEIEN
jgi:hypothetical protein